ncbi:MAG: hypothetical protein SGJ11_11135 [Phycisphaerae bacterium]|nr:hypothetical protein [Phycisphaerae bacterium]
MMFARRVLPYLTALRVLVSVVPSLAVGAQNDHVGQRVAPPLEAAAADALQRKIDRTLEARRWSEALDLIAEYTRDVRRDPIMFYNAACCQAQLGAKDAAAQSLLDAVKAGFLEFDAMEEDPDLEPIREHPTYTAILEARDVIKSRARNGQPAEVPAAVPRLRPRSTSSLVRSRMSGSASTARRTIASKVIRSAGCITRPVSTKRRIANCANLSNVKPTGSRAISSTTRRITRP